MAVENKPNGEDLEAILEAMDSPAIQLVSLTIEKNNYMVDSVKDVDTDSWTHTFNPRGDVMEDIDSQALPKTALGEMI
jgi:mannitol-1-phosphate/altronate dehydrogenase